MEEADGVTMQAIITDGFPEAPIEEEILAPAGIRVVTVEGWVRLLATAADADATELNRTYADILKGLTARDARLLDWILDHRPELDDNDPNVVYENQPVGPTPEFMRRRVERRTVVEEFGLPDDEFELVASRLETIGLCDVGHYVFPHARGVECHGASGIQLDTVAADCRGITKGMSALAPCGESGFAGIDRCDP